MNKIVTPLLAVDIIMYRDERIVLVKRKNEPHGWALPGGFVDVGETVEAAAMREAKEETGCTITKLWQFDIYSEPERDPRGHVVSIVFEGRFEGEPIGADDSSEARLFTFKQMEDISIVFDHKKIIKDFFIGDGE